MQENTLKLLEEKVLDAVQRIQELRSENEQLRESRKTMEAELTALQERYDESQHDLVSAKKRAAEVEQFEDHRQIIEEKVGGLLEKLDAIE